MSRIGHWVWEARLLFKCFNLRNWSQQRVHWPHGKDSSHWGTNWSTRHWFYLIFVYIYTSILSHACMIPWHKKHLHWLIWRWSWRKSLHLITTYYDLRSVSNLQILHSTDSGTCCQFILLQTPPMRKICICNCLKAGYSVPHPNFLIFPCHEFITMAINYRISRMGSLVFHLLGIHMAPTPPWWGRGRQMPRPPVVNNLGFDNGFMWCWTFGLKWFRMVQNCSKWFKMV